MITIFPRWNRCASLAVCGISFQNPQVIDFLGQYAWYVPVGEWKVVYEKEGNESLETGWLPVPPPQTEVNVSLISYEAPTVRHAALYADAVKALFTKYMEPESVNSVVQIDAAVLVHRSTPFCTPGLSKSTATFARIEQADPLISGDEKLKKRKTLSSHNHQLSWWLE